MASVRLAVGTGLGESAVGGPDAFSRIRPGTCGALAGLGVQVDTAGSALAGYSARRILVQLLTSPVSAAQLPEYRPSNTWLALAPAISPAHRQWPGGSGSRKRSVNTTFSTSLVTTMAGKVVAAGPGRLIAIALCVLLGISVHRRCPSPAEIVWVGGTGDGPKVRFRIRHEPILSLATFSPRSPCRLAHLQAGFAVVVAMAAERRSIATNIPALGAGGFRRSQCLPSPSCSVDPPQRSRHRGTAKSRWRSRSPRLGHPSSLSPGEALSNGDVPSFLAHRWGPTSSESGWPLSSNERQRGESGASNSARPVRRAASNARYLLCARGLHPGIAGGSCQRRLRCDPLAIRGAYRGVADN